MVTLIKFLISYKLFSTKQMLNFKIIQKLKIFGFINRNIYYLISLFLVGVILLWLLFINISDFYDQINTAYISDPEKNYYLKYIINIFPKWFLNGKVSFWRYKLNLDLYESSTVFFYCSIFFEFLYQIFVNLWVWVEEIKNELLMCEFTIVYFVKITKTMGFVYLSEIFLFFSCLRLISKILYYKAFLGKTAIFKIYRTVSARYFLFTLIQIFQRNLLVITLILCFHPIFWTEFTVFYYEFLQLTKLTIFVKIVFLLLCRNILKVVFTFIHIRPFFFTSDLLVIFAFFIFFSIMCVNSNNLILTFFLLEMIFFCLITFICYDVLNKDQTSLKITYYGANVLMLRTTIDSIFSKYTISAAITYFLYNVLYSSFFLCAISFFFFQIGFFSYDLFQFELSNILQITKYVFFNLTEYGQLKIFFLLMSTLFCFSFFFFKIGLFPFHMWLLNVVKHANFFSLIVILIPFKIIIFYVLIKLFYVVFQPLIYILQSWFYLVIIITLLYSSFGLYNQLNIRRFLFYSTINNAGYIVLGLSINTINSLYATLYYMIIYLISLYGFLLFFMTTKNEKTQELLTSFSELTSIFNMNTLVRTFLILLIFSMIGIPPLAGFWGKFYIINTLICQETFITFFLIGIIIVTTCIVAYSYLRLVINYFVFTDFVNNTNIVTVYSSFLVSIFNYISFFLIFSEVFYFFLFKYCFFFWL
jgi:NADH-quinone oxidoreductase subunit N